MGTVHAKEMPKPKSRALGDEGEEHEIRLSNVPAKVKCIHIDGVCRTKDDIVTKQVRPVFSANNFEDMVKKVEESRLQMQQLGLFKRVGVFIDVSKGANSAPDGYEITYNVQETRRVTGGISTLVGTNDGSLLLQCRLPNTFGRGERLSGEYTYGSKSTIGYGLNFVKPFIDDPKISLTFGGYQVGGEYPWSGYRETDRGLIIDYAFPTRFGSHNVRWEGVWRELGALSSSTAFSVREQSGHSIKSSLKHTWTRDQRDDHVIPNNGYLVRVTQELAGLGGDVNHIKYEKELQVSKMVFLDTVFQLSLAGGMMKSIRPEEKILINDRFFLGGPLTLRGFNIKGVGPHENGNALGADAYWQAGAHIYTPLPFRVGKGGFGDLFRTHFFANAGNLENINFGGDWRNNIENLAYKLRWAYGAGIVMRLGGIARLELNYCVPVKYQPGDSTNPGVQVGVGVNFL